MKRWSLADFRIIKVWPSSILAHLNVINGFARGCLVAEPPTGRLAIARLPHFLKCYLKRQHFITHLRGISSAALRADDLARES